MPVLTLRMKKSYRNVAQTLLDSSIGLVERFDPGKCRGWLDASGVSRSLDQRENDFPHRMSQLAHKV
jgi:hypothetical protein